LDILSNISNSISNRTVTLELTSRPIPNTSRCRSKAACSPENNPIRTGTLKITVNAGKDANIIASDLLSQKGNIDLSAQNVHLDSGVEESYRGDLTGQAL